MNPILTFVVPCYNSEAYMSHCIDSLLRPGVTDVEVVVVNDKFGIRLTDIVTPSERMRKAGR